MSEDLWRQACQESREERGALRDMLKRIARGRQDNGRPLGGETARQMARDMLSAVKVAW